MKTQTNKTQEPQNSITPRVTSESSNGGTAQLKDNRTSSLDQRKLISGIDRPNNGKNSIQRKNNNGLPDTLKSGIENLSGYSMDDVKVHYNSSKPAQLQAHAYAQGTDIHLGPGQQKHLPHEAWHVVQQKQGRVKPTRQLKSKVNINDDAGLEKEADVMGAKAQNYKKEPKILYKQGKRANEERKKDSKVVQRNALELLPNAENKRKFKRLDVKDSETDRVYRVGYWTSGKKVKIGEVFKSYYVILLPFGFPKKMRTEVENKLPGYPGTQVKYFYENQSKEMIFVDENDGVNNFKELNDENGWEIKERDARGRVIEYLEQMKGRNIISEDIYNQSLKSLEEIKVKVIFDKTEWSSTISKLLLQSQNPNLCAGLKHKDKPIVYINANLADTGTIIHELFHVIQRDMVDFDERIFDDIVEGSAEFFAMDVLGLDVHKQQNGEEHYRAEVSMLIDAIEQGYITKEQLFQFNLVGKKGMDENAYNVVQKLNKYMQEQMARKSDLAARGKTKIKEMTFREFLIKPPDNADL